MMQDVVEAKEELKKLLYKVHKGIASKNEQDRVISLKKKIAEIEWNESKD